MTNHAIEVRYLLSDARQLCAALGWMGGAKKAGTDGILIRCPVHNERHASCWVRRRGDGTLSMTCQSCGANGDALTMVALAYGLDIRSNFHEVLIAGAELGGNLALADEIRNGRSCADAPRRQPVPQPPPVPDSPMMSASEIDSVFGLCVQCSSDPDANRVLSSRAINPAVVDSLGLAAVIPRGVTLPGWASIETDDERVVYWTETGHRLIVKLYNSDGVARGVRGWQVDRANGIKRLPARGRRGVGLVLANAAGVGLLSWTSSPDAVIFVEGEPDFITWATRVPDSVAVIGVGSGWWTKGHADKVLPGTPVAIRAHCDSAGERYANQIASSLPSGVNVWRLRQDGADDENDKASAGVLADNPFDSCVKINSI